MQVRHKRYETHYQIPADRSLVVPLRALGDEVACDVRWENENGELNMLENIVFVSDNLMPINALSDTSLLEIWQHYYSPSEKKSEPQLPSN